MIIIADSGSTKVDWRLVDKGQEIKRVSTNAANPFFCTPDDIRYEIESDLLPLLKDYQVDKVYFFGAGCNTIEKKAVIKDILANTIDTDSISVESDLLGAAIGLCGDTEGIVCILGTGSNSCHYDGKSITEQISPLGYILGDEGSGAVLGRLFINACLKNQLSSDIKTQFLNEYNLNTALILDKVYREPMPNRFLAGFSPFIHRNIHDEQVYRLVYNSFRDFFIKNVMQYTNWNSLPIHMTGSVAYYYKDILSNLEKELDIDIKTIVRSPMDGLIKYYSEKQRTK